MRQTLAFIFSKSGRKCSFRILLVGTVILGMLQLLWTRGPDLDPEAQYEWMVQNRYARQYVLPDQETTLLQPRPPECGDGTRLLIVVPSAPHNQEIRQAIRDTWGHADPESRSRLVFFLGHSGDGNNILDEVREEAKTHNDVVVEDFVDAYVNLTLKTIFMLKWTVRHCSSVPFLLKTDDDMLINVRRLLDELPEKFHPSTPLVIGRIQENARPYRDKTSKWYLPFSLYEQPAFPTFAAGTGYLITKAALVQIYSSALDTPIIPLEDVFLTGLVANAKLGIPLVSLQGFHNKKPASSEHACLYYPHLTLHELTPGQMRRVWDSLQGLRAQDCDTLYTRFLIYMFGIGKSEVDTDYTW